MLFTWSNSSPPFGCQLCRSEHLWSQMGNVFHVTVCLLSSPSGNVIKHNHINLSSHIAMIKKHLGIWFKRTHKENRIYNSDYYCHYYVVKLSMTLLLMLSHVFRPGWRVSCHHQQEASFSLTTSLWSGKMTLWWRLLSETPPRSCQTHNLESCKADRCLS